MDTRHSKRRQDTASTQDRRRDERSHGQPVYAGTTIRTVTPESIPEGSIANSPYRKRSFTATSPPGSPPSRTRDSPRDGSRLMRGLSEDTYDMRSLRERDRNRPRTRTLEERQREASPSSMFNNMARQRVGSLHSGTSSQYQGPAEMVTSIGHPSTVPGPAYDSMSRSTRNRITKPPPSQSPSPALLPAPQPDSLPDPIRLTEPRKILYLMKSTRGRMEGSLAFRRGGSSPWSLSYCHIDDESGSLVYEPKSDTAYYRTLLPDLRSCHVKVVYDSESLLRIMEVRPQNSRLEVHLRPHSDDEFEAWFAALMCWYPIQPKGIHNKMTKPHAPLGTGGKLLDSRRHSEVSLVTKDAPIIKVGKMILWEFNAQDRSRSRSNGRPPNNRMQSMTAGVKSWRRVSSTLRENGELKLYTDTDVALIHTVNLSVLSRCAIQRLDQSVLDEEFSIGIYPQYSVAGLPTTPNRPIYVSLESRVLYEVWIVLLRAFTVPQLYGPRQSSPVGSDVSSQAASGMFTPPTQDMFRMERSLQAVVIEAKLLAQPQFQSHTSRPSSSAVQQPNASGGHFVEVHLDGEIRAKTMDKTEETNPFWREEFEFWDLPAVLSAATFYLRKRPPSAAQSERTARDEKKTRNNSLNRDDDDSGALNGITYYDQVLGKVDIYLDDLEPGKELEKWWPLHNMNGVAVGEILVRVRIEEAVILMARDYQPMSELLHKFGSGLTGQLASFVPGELKRLSECLLNIFQVSGSAGEWIMALIEEEIDGTIKESSSTRIRLSRRMGSNDSHDSHSTAGEREHVLRELGKSATVEANLLFRGNTLLTKSLDAHMKRLGKEYLEETLGDRLKEIADRDPDCEVDPNRVQSQHELDRNWRRLLSVTEELWKAIFQSANRCPPELKVIFRHVRACAEDRYGDFLRTVSYSSVSGFLFLRFFCPAVLNPKLFGLLKDHPKPRARRTLTLVAKSLNSLANMTSFGQKEYWMEPMNQFLTSHRAEFKSFIESVCTLPADASALSTIPPSYSTPLAILTRLPPTAREGFPSLPYLIDHARNFAALVNLWLEHTTIGEENIPSSESDLLKFHNLCTALQARTEEALNKAERAERPSSAHSFQWEELVEQLEAFQTGGSSSARDPTEPGSLPSENNDPYRSASDNLNTTPLASKTFRNPSYGANMNNNDRLGSHPSSATQSQYATSSAASASSDTPPGSAGHADSLHNSEAESGSVSGTSGWDQHTGNPFMPAAFPAANSNVAGATSSSLPTNAASGSSYSSKHSRKPPSLGSRSQNSAINYNVNNLPTPNTISFYDQRNHNIQIQNQSAGSTPNQTALQSPTGGPGSTVHSRGDSMADIGGSRSLESSMQNLSIASFDNQRFVPAGPLSPGSEGSGGETTALPRFDGESGGREGRKGSVFGVFGGPFGGKRRKER